MDRPCLALSEKVSPRQGVSEECLIFCYENFLLRSGLGGIEQFFVANNDAVVFQDYLLVLNMSSVNA